MRAMPRRATYANGRVETSLRVPEELLGRLEAEAARRGISRNLLMERCLEHALARFEDSDPTAAVLPPVVPSHARQDAQGDQADISAGSSTATRLQGLGT